MSEFYHVYPRQEVFNKFLKSIAISQAKPEIYKVTFIISINQSKKFYNRLKQETVGAFSYAEGV